MTLHEQRQLIQRLIEDNSIVDAPTAYYALYYDPNRSQIAVSLRTSGRPQGFAGRFQTGQDLFRPLVTLRCNTAEVAADLLAQLLIVGRPYLFFVNARQFSYLGGSVEVHSQRLLHIYYLDSRYFRPTINVLVRELLSPDGLPRYEINNGEHRAVAGLNWQSPGFAEVYVQVDPPVRKRGWGQAVVTACTEYVVRSGRQPLYLVEPENEDSLRLAGAVGYVDSGARQIYAEGTYLGHPALLKPPAAPEEAEAESTSPIRPAAPDSPAAE